MNEQVSVGDITVNYRVEGPADGPVVVMAHALGTNLKIWDQQVPALVDRYRIVRYDWRGHGGTDAPEGPYSLDLFVTDAVGLFDALDLDQVHFVGLSTGGMIAQGLALGHPDRIRSISLCNTASWWPNDEIGSNIDNRRRQLAAGGMAEVWDNAKAVFFTDEFIAAAGDRFQATRQAYIATTATGHVAALHAAAALNYRDQLANITAPALVIGSRDDPLTPPSQAETMHKRIPDCEIQLIDGRHLSNVDVPDQFNPRLRAFLDRVS